MTRPSYCLSIQQPWAWLIVAGWKDIENRKWATPHRGRTLVHAGKKVDADALTHLRCRRNPANPDLPLPAEVMLPEDWQTGGIVGAVTIVGCVTQSRSPWFGGPYGFVLRNGEPLRFSPCRGQLGFWVPPLDARRLAWGETA